jgi:hypothetical protein
VWFANGRVNRNIEEDLIVAGYESNAMARVALCELREDVPAALPKGNEKNRLAACGLDGDVLDAELNGKKATAEISGTLAGPEADLRTVAGKRLSGVGLDDD